MLARGTALPVGRRLLAAILCWQVAQLYCWLEPKISHLVLAGGTVVPVGRGLIAAIMSWQVAQLYMLAGD
jgi:hypothetical protein